MIDHQVLLLSHHNEVEGMADQLYDYLIKHFAKVIHISHPLNPSSSVKSFVRVGKTRTKFKVPSLFQFFSEGLFMLLTLHKLKQTTSGYQLAICIDPLSYLHARIFKGILKINKLVYYNVDYSTQRYSNKLLDYVYQKINLYAFHNCEVFFYITSKFLKDLDPKGKYINKSFRIRHIHNTTKPGQVAKIPQSIIFCGNISDGVDFSDLLSALNKLRQEKVNFTFDIYGSGSKLKNLLILIKSLNLEKYIHLKGNISHHSLIDNVMPKYMIGVAPYIAKYKFSKKAANHPFAGEDLSTKIVEYIGSGLPVISTKPFQEFKVISKYKFGYLVSNSLSWYKALFTLLKNQRIRKIYSQNAYQYSRKYHEEEILTPIIKQIL